MLLFSVLTKISFWCIHQFLICSKNSMKYIKETKETEEKGEFIHQTNNLIQHSKKIKQFLVKRQTQFIQAFELENEEDFKYNQKVYCLSSQENILRIGLFQFKLDQVTTELLQKILKFSKQKENSFHFSEFVNGLDLFSKNFENYREFYSQVVSKIRTVLNSEVHFGRQLKKMIMVKEIKEINFINLTRLHLDSTIDNYQLFSLIDFSKVKGFYLIIRGFRLKNCKKIFLPELENVSLQSFGQLDIHQNFVIKKKTVLNKKNPNFFYFGFENCYDLGNLVKGNEYLKSINIYRSNSEMMEKTIRMVKDNIQFRGYQLFQTNQIIRKIIRKQLNKRRIL